MLKVLLLPFFILFFLTSCEWKSARSPSILILAVEGLDFRLVSCGSGEAQAYDGFELICNDSVRFTHAYTPSTLSQSNLASVLTALPPEAHGVLHNGNSYLPEKIETISESAIKAGYRTSFFSGGPPIWRKSGFAQGFELFEDNISVRIGNYYRPARESFNFFFNWLDQEVRGAPFLSVIFISDLQFPNTQTRARSGELRALGIEGQIKELEESLYTLVRGLKERKSWFPTHIFLVGLNGKTERAREGEIRALNLHAENTQVTLMIKPARRERDEPIQWTIDANVTLMDVGRTIYELLGREELSIFGPSRQEVVSLSSVLERPNVSWRKDRFLLIESTWADWRGVGPVRHAMRQDHMFLLYDSTPKLFNTLIDRNETSPLPPNDPSGRVYLQNMLGILESREYLPWGMNLSSLAEKISLAGILQNPLGISREEHLRLQHLVRMRPWDEQVLGWLAQLLIDQEDWIGLEAHAKEALNPLWDYLAKTRLEKQVSPPTDICFDLMFSASSFEELRTRCSDSLFVSFLSWIHEKDNKTRARLEDRFVNEYILYKIDKQISNLNYLNGLTWDTAVDLPAGPHAVEIALLLPRFKRQLGVVHRRLQRLVR